MTFGKSLFIYNPISGPDKKRIPIEFLSENLKLCSIEFDTLITKYAGHASEYLKGEKKRFDTIICSGGDGTVNEIINSNAMNYNPSILLISQGTGNDLQRSLFPHLTSNNINRLDFNTYTDHINVDIGLVEGIYSDGTSFSKKFCNAIGIGLDSLIAKYVSEIKKRNNLSYIKSLLKAVWHYKPLQCTINNEEFHLDNKMILLSINNGKTSGGGFYLAPDAKLDDRLLDLCFINVLSKPRVLFNFSKVLTNRIKEFKEVQLFQGTQFTVRLEKPYHLHIDGEMERKMVKELNITLTESAIKFYHQKFT